jgi:lysozyme
MVISNKLKELVKEFEGCKLKAYKCPAGIWTIGYGNTQYENGKAVKEGDVITLKRAEQLLEIILIKFIQQVGELVKSNINQNQKDALTDFAYNCGVGNLKTSTLLKKVNADPKDKTIRAEFEKWTRANGKVLNGLVKRRNAEANLYFS